MQKWDVHSGCAVFNISARFVEEFQKIFEHRRVKVVKIGLKLCFLLFCTVAPFQYVGVIDEAKIQHPYRIL